MKLLFLLPAIVTRFHERMIELFMEQDKILKRRGKKKLFAMILKIL